MKLTKIIFVGCLAATACKTSPLSEDSELYTDPSETTFPEEVVTFQTSRASVQEKCVIPAHIEGGDYRKKDRKDEQDLCSYSFYEQVNGEQKVMGVCPKLKNTNPSLELYKVSSREQKTQFEREMCQFVDRDLKKIGKFKTTITCGYTGSILGYYHMSRLLGNILNIEPAVYRTIELSHIKNQAENGYSLSRRIRRIRPSWRAFKDALSPGTRKYRDYWPLLNTDDGRQIFGAITKIAKQEYELVELHTLDAEGRRVKDMAKLRQKTLIKNVTEPGRGALPRYSDILAQHKDILLRKDISEMILIDFIFGQQDRGYNIHARDYMYYIDENGEVDRKKVKKFEALQGSEQLRSVRIPRIVLKDNDCGVRSGRKIRDRTALLYELTHLDPNTYQKLLWLEANWRVIEPQFKKVTAMSVPNISGNNIDNVVSTNLKKAVSVLKERCMSGKLYLDLDVNPRQVTAYSHSSNVCELSL